MYYNFRTFNDYHNDLCFYYCHHIVLLHRDNFYIRHLSYRFLTQPLFSHSLTTVASKQKCKWRSRINEMHDVNNRCTQSGPQSAVKFVEPDRLSPWGPSGAQKLGCCGCNLCFSFCFLFLWRYCFLL